MQINSNYNFYHAQLQIIYSSQVVAELGYFLHTIYIKIYCLRISESRIVYSSQVDNKWNKHTGKKHKRFHMTICTPKQAKI